MIIRTRAVGYVATPADPPHPLAVLHISALDITAAHAIQLNGHWFIRAEAARAPELTRAWETLAEPNPVPA